MGDFAYQIDELKSGFKNLLNVRLVGDRIRVTTQCTYPSGGFIEVSVIFGRTTAVVTDDGGAYSEILSAGIQSYPSDGQLASLFREQGLSFKNGIVSAFRVPVAALPIAVLLVANACKELTHKVYLDARAEIKRDFRKSLSQLLAQTFDGLQIAHNAKISGKYKRHNFTNVIHLDAERRMIVDPVFPDDTSINTRIISHLDLKKAQKPNYLQRIVYDEEDKWNPDMFSLLGMAEVPLIRFSQSKEALLRAAASVH